MTTQIRRNQKAQRCSACGVLVAAGAGSLVHYDEEEIDDMFGFGSQMFAGWHVFCSDVAACKARIDEAREQYHEAERLRKEKEESEQREKQARLDADKARYAAFRGSRLAGLVETTEVPGFSLPSDARPIEHFISGWHTTGDHWYEVVLADGTPLLVCYYGNAVLYYVTPEAAARFYESKWNERAAKYGASQVAQWALGRHERGFGCYGDDLYRWAVEHFGIDTLTAQARQIPLFARVRTNLEDQEFPPLAAKYGLRLIMLTADYTTVDKARERDGGWKPTHGRSAVQMCYRGDDGKDYVQRYDGSIEEAC